MASIMLFRLLTSCSQWAYRQAGTGYLLILLTLFLGFNLWVFPGFMQEISPDGSIRILDLRFGFSPGEARQTLEAMGEGGRAAYLRMLLADMIYPLIYGLLLIFVSSLLLDRTLARDSFWRILNLGAVDAVLFDLCENIGIMAMINTYPDIPPGLARVASICNMLKWIAIALCILVILTALMRLLVERMRRTSAASE